MIKKKNKVEKKMKRNEVELNMESDYGEKEIKK